MLEFAMEKPKFIGVFFWTVTIVYQQFLIQNAHSHFSTSIRSCVVVERSVGLLML